MTTGVLYIIHNPAWTGCRVAETASSSGYDVNYLCPPRRDALPDDVSAFAGIVVGGNEDGHADRSDEFAWVADEMAFMRRVVDAGIPTLGICRGAHFEGIVALPDEAVLLVSGERFPVQAFRIGQHVYGLQFHPDTKLDALTPEALQNDPYIDMLAPNRRRSRPAWRLSTN